MEPGLPVDGRSTSDVIAASPPPSRGRRREAALLVAAAVLLTACLLLPWWAEEATFGGIRETESYSAWNGVTVACTPSCGILTFSPTPDIGTNSFSSMGLNDTEHLYWSTLALVFVALGATLLTLVQLRAKRPAPPGRESRFGTEGLPALGLLGAALAAALLPLLQPYTLRRDVASRFDSGNQWTPSPSPEATFWGACSPGADRGVCASGAAVAWGPALGWILLVAAVVVLALALVERRRRPTSAPNSEPRSV